MKAGRASAHEVSALEYGMDFRLPEYRREVFLRFYEFHLKHRSHPGAVYYVLPHLAHVHVWTVEQRLWFAYINGNTQHPPTSWLIFQQFPDVHTLDPAKLEAWFKSVYARLAFDTDRRYFKKSFLVCVANYRKLLGGRSQEEFFQRGMTEGDPQMSFRTLWDYVGKHYEFFGRLSVFSYLEYLRIMGVPIECDQLFLHDLNGSKSHRNGMCKVMGRDDLDWHDSNPGFAGSYTPQVIGWLTEEAEMLLTEARARMAGKTYVQDVGYFTLESALCTYKSWHRPNRRYPNCYNDMFLDRLRASEATWGKQFESFWAARKAFLPEHLRLEDNPADCGLKPAKQNHYLKTGQPVMMDKEWPCFRNDFNDAVDRSQR